MIIRGGLSDYRWRSWMNTGSDAVCPFGLIRIYDADVIRGKLTRLGTQPDYNTDGVFAVNGPTWVYQNKPGLCVSAGEVIVTYASGETPALGDQFGPKNGYNEAYSDGSPAILTVVGVIDSDNRTMLAMINQSSSTRLAWATTTADVHSSDATFTVTSISPIGGWTYDGDDPLTVRNAPFNFGIAEGTRGIIQYIDKHSGTGQDWYADKFDIDCTLVD